MENFRGEKSEGSWDLEICRQPNDPTKPEGRSQYGLALGQRVVTTLS